MKGEIAKEVEMDNQGKRILDPCCGSKMFYFDKHNDDTGYFAYGQYQLDLACAW